MPFRSLATRVLLRAALLATLPACGPDDGSRASGDPDAAGAFAGRRNLPPYRVVQVATPGTVVGTIQADGDIPRDTAVQTTRDQRVCGERFLDRTVWHDGRRIAHVVVWLEGVRAGKALPLTRRFEVASRRCALEPRVQAVLAGGTLNVKSADPAIHHMRIVDAASGRTIEVVEQNDEGQVVPVQSALSHPGRLELRCDQHPWTRGWVQVFDHPYFAMTDDRGDFAIDGVPPGQYRLRAWHERLGAVERVVRVAAGRTHRVDVKL